ncbi:MAG: hypothetical protein QM692_23710, partial [Thermomicrobiales bacterium]
LDLGAQAPADGAAAGRLHALACDVSNPDSLRAAFQTIAASIASNCASTLGNSPAATSPGRCSWRCRSCVRPRKIVNGLSSS